MGKRVLDLNAGLGGRIYAFEKAGFEIAAAIDHDYENCEIMTAWMGEDKAFYYDLLEIDPDMLPDADIVTAKYLQQVSYNMSHQRRIVSANENDAIFGIILRKKPIVFLLEVPVSSITTRREILEDYIQKYSTIGYSVSYAIYDEMYFSGYPMVGRQGYVIGYRNDENVEFMFPTTSYQYSERMLQYDSPVNINPWYRKLNFATTDWKRGCMYLRTHGTISKIQRIHMGYMRENYYVDQIGPRRFTHNELAALKGLYEYNYNKTSNKYRMYNKIAYATNVYVAKAIADEIGKYICSVDEKKSNRVNVESADSEAREKGEPKKKILFPKQRLKEVSIQKLKGINNLSFTIDKELVALMGVNGSGKSTILHALACAYAPYQNGDDYRFSYFFTPNPDASWNGSCFTIVNYDYNEQKDIPKTYEKKEDRWVRYNTRPQRDVYFLGISSCMPAIEVEKKTTYISYTSKELTDKSTNRIKDTAAVILNKDYDGLFLHEAAKKKYMGVHTKAGMAYSALSMGAGEQRVIKILQTVYSANQYSLVLIDEIDLLLHADAFRKLIMKLSEIAKEKNLQIIFTTHSLEMQYLSEYADIRYIVPQKEKTLVYDSINPDLLYQMSGELKKTFTIYVEDNFASAIVWKVARDLNMQRHISVIKYGSIDNAFVIAAGKILSEDVNIENVLIVTDGDRFATIEEKEKRLKNVLTGTEKEHDIKIQQALAMMTQFNLPKDISPEKYIHSLLITMDDSLEYVRCAKNIIMVNDSHEWIDKIAEQIGVGEQVYYSIMDIIAENKEWMSFVGSIYNWIKEKKEEIELTCGREG